MSEDFKIAHSKELISEDAINEIAASIDTSDDALKFIFFSSNYNKFRMQNALKSKFGRNVMACSTAGEISPKGFTKYSTVGASISSKIVKFKKYEINDLTKFNINDAFEIRRDFDEEFNFNINDVDKYAGILLIDGKSMLEDKVIALLYKVFMPLKIVGGSAGDDLHFVETNVFNDGELRSNAASLVLLRSETPFRVFKTQFFKPMSDKIVITDASPRQRIVYEINGERAAIEYANILNIPVEELNPYTFAKHPFVLQIGNNLYVRSIEKMNNDYSLSFFSAIDVGLVLRVAEPTDIVQDYSKLFDNLKNELGENYFLIAFDCIHRRYLAEHDKIDNEVNNLFRLQNVVGFHTYGEQFMGMHTNQTLTGIAFAL